MNVRLAVCVAASFAAAVVLAEPADKSAVQPPCGMKKAGLSKPLLVPGPGAVRFPQWCRDVRLVKTEDGKDAVSLSMHYKGCGLNFSRHGWGPAGLFAPRLPRSADTEVTAFFNQTQTNQILSATLLCTTTDGKHKVFEAKADSANPGGVCVKFRLGETGVPDVDAKKIEKPCPWAVIGFTVNVTHGTEKHPIRFDGLAASVTASPAEALELELETGTAHHAVAKGRNTVTARIINILEIPFEGKAALQVKDSRGVAFGKATEMQLALAAGGEKNVEIPVPGPYGVYEVDLKTEANGNVALRRKTFANVEHTPRRKFKKGDYEFGCVDHLNPYIGFADRIEESAEAMASVGFNILRTDFRMPAESEYAMYDDIVSSFGKRGLDFDLILTYDTGKEGRIDLSKTIGNWKRHFGRYRGKVRYWEVLNEPDQDWGRKHPATPAEYTELCRLGKAALGEIDPSAELMSAGFCLFNHKIMGEFQKEAMRTAKEFVDYHCFHGHGDPDWYEEMMEQKFLPLRNELRISVPWYANETALTSVLPVTTVDQAGAFWKKAVTSQALGSRGFIWYNLREKGVDPADGEHRYGMLTIDFYPKAVYAAADAATRLLGGCEFVKKLPYGDRNNAYLYRREGEETLVVWRVQRNRKGPKEETLCVKVSGETAEFVDIFGNRRPAPVRNGVVEIVAGPEPCSLNVRGGTIAVP